jgi:rare lipoprotein A
MRMVLDRNRHRVTPSRPRWFWAVAGGLSLAAAVAVFTDSTLTVQADAPLARPASTLPPAAPPASLLAEGHAAVKHLFSPEELGGIATWYGQKREGHWTASGERFDMMAMTAAHKTLPFGTLLRVVDLKTRKSVVVRVNDRGVLPGNHVIDLSYGAAEELNIVKTGIAPVRLEIISLGHPERQSAAPAPAAATPDGVSAR